MNKYCNIMGCVGCKSERLKKKDKEKRLFMIFNQGQDLMGVWVFR